MFVNQILPDMEPQEDHIQSLLRDLHNTIASAVETPSVAGRRTSALYREMCEYIQPLDLDDG
jgi:hypothetical protein